MSVEEQEEKEKNRHYPNPRKNAQTPFFLHLEPRYMSNGFKISLLGGQNKTFNPTASPTRKLSIFTTLP